MGLQLNEKGEYSRKKDRYQPPEAGLLSQIKDVGFRIQSYHLLYNEEDPGTNHLIADVDLGSSTPSQVEAVFPASEDEYGEEFFAEFEAVLGRISTSFGNLLQMNSDIEGFSLNIKGTPVHLRLIDKIRKG
jgi:hypothetical protein